MTEEVRPHTGVEGPARYQQRIWALIRARQLHAAAEQCRHLNEVHADFAPGWITASHVFLQLGQPGKALQLAEHALLLQGELEHADLYSHLGLLYTNAGKYAQALLMYQKAVDLQPGNAGHLFNRATLRRFLGDLVGAEADYDRAIELAPRDYEAYLNRSDLRRQSSARNHTDELERLLAAGVDEWAGRIQIHFALAKEYEDLQQFGQAFRQFELGAALRRKHLRYDVEKDLAIVNAIIGTFTKDVLIEAPRIPLAHKPIFVFGLPRSGTTLVERILGCHSAVFPAGELNEFASSVMDIAAESALQRAPAIELIQKSARCDFGRLGERYIARTSHLLGDEKYFTDKMPLNYLYCGLIAVSLPEAKLLHVVRHPMAVCFAMYKTLFKQGYPFSYSFAEIARYYVAYKSLMNHWKRLLPIRILEVSYERLVLDQRGESQRIVSFCGLPWEERCLDFHKSPYPSSTASASQVRRPLYQSSLYQWREYAEKLVPLKECLLRAGVRSDELE